MSVTVRYGAPAATESASVGGHKTAWREYDDAGLLVRETFTTEASVSRLASLAPQPAAPLVEVRRPAGDAAGRLQSGGASKPRGAHPVQIPVMRQGVTIHEPGIEDVRAFTTAAVSTLPTEALSVAAGAPYLTVTLIEEEQT